MPQRLAEFSECIDGSIPLLEVEEFYSLGDVAPSSERPFTWTQSVSSLDGRISYGPGTLPPAIALSGVPEAKAGASGDWRLLQAGWSLADAVLISGSCLRSEPETTLRVTQVDLIEMRIRLGYRSRQPMRVILTGSGDIDPAHLLFQRSPGDESMSLIATTMNGLVTFKAKLEGLGLKAVSWPLHDQKIDGLEAFLVRHNNSLDPAGIKIVIAQDDGAEAVSYQKLLNYLRKVEAVRFLDVSAGGVAIGGLLAEKLIDEMRVTLAGNLVGIGPTLISFPSTFQVSPETTPLVRYDHLRSLGPNHLFIRGCVIYRH